MSHARWLLVWGVVALTVIASAAPSIAAESPFALQTVDSLCGSGISTILGHLVVSPSGQLVATDGVMGTRPASATGGTPYLGRMFVPSGAGWVRRGSEPPLDISFDHALVFDPADRLHVLSWQNACTDSSLPVLLDEGDRGWSATVMDTTAVTSVGLAFDSNAELWATWLRVHRSTKGFLPPYELVIAHRTALGWARDSLVVPEAAWNYTPYPIAIDGEGHPHVLYVGAGQTGLFHAVRTEAGWQTTTVDEGMIAPDPWNWQQPAPVLALAPDGTAHVLYRRGLQLWHARLVADEWLRDSLPEPPARIAEQSMVLDRAGQPRVAYLAAADFRDYYYDNIVYASWANGAWQIVPTTWGITLFSGGNLSLVLDSNESPLIYFAGPELCGLAVARLIPTAGVAPPALPTRIGLALVSRNPSRSGEQTLWSVSLPRPAAITLEAFDLAGRRVGSSGPRSAPTGTSVIAWDPGPMGPGGYFVRLSALGEHSAAVLVLVRR